jgi:hypothetical protein
MTIIEWFHEYLQESVSRYRPFIYTNEYKETHFPKLFVQNLEQSSLTKNGLDSAIFVRDCN